MVYTDMDFECISTHPLTKISKYLDFYNFFKNKINLPEFGSQNIPFPHSKLLEHVAPETFTLHLLETQ